MIFDDVFYPGNPKRRAEVASLHAEIKLDFNNYKTQWNKLVGIFNSAFAALPKEHEFSGLRIEALKLEIEKDEMKEIVEEIHLTLEDMKTKFKKVIEDIKLDKLLPSGWAEKGVKLEDIGDLQMLEIGKILSGLTSLTLAGLLGWYVFTGVTIASNIIAVIAGIASSVAISILATAIVSSVAFILTDMVFSAITGAIERKQLNDAIDVLKLAKEESNKLNAAQVRIAAIIMQIDEGYYRIDDLHILRWDKEEQKYVIVNVKTGVITPFISLKMAA